jgi:tetratricopeptide (TPR) repeat protein
MNDYCDREDWLAAYLDKTLSAKERFHIERHLATCSKCLSELISAKMELDDVLASIASPRAARGFIRSMAARTAASLPSLAGPWTFRGPVRLSFLSHSISATLALIIGISFLCLIDTRPYDPNYKEATYLLQKIMSAGHIGPLRLSEGRQEPPAGTSSLRSGGSLHRNLTVRTERTLQEALRRYPGDYVILNALGHLYISTGRPERAETYYENALLLKPHDPRILNNIAVAAYRRGESSRALRHLVQAEKLNGSLAEIVYNIAILYGESGERELQQSYLRRFFELDETSPWAEQARTLIND